MPIKRLHICQIFTLIHFFEVSKEIITDSIPERTKETAKTIDLLAALWDEIDHTIKELRKMVTNINNTA